MVRILFAVLLATPLSAAEPWTVTREEAQQIAPVTAAECQLPWESGDPAIREHRGPAGGAVAKSSGLPAPPLVAELAAPPAPFGFHASTSTVYSPADAAGAVGAKHVVTACNAGMWVHDRAGTLLATFPTFWSEGFEGRSFDPRLEHDPAADRWVTAAVNDNGFGARSGVVFAVSTGADPAGTWRRYKIGTLNNASADYIELAQTKDSFVLTFNVVYAQAGGKPGSNIVVIDKAALYALPATLPFSRYERPGDYDTTPVSVRDSADGAPRLLFIKGLETTLARISGGTIVEVGRIPAPQGASTAAFQYAPQLGSQMQLRVESWDISSAVMRNDVLWYTRTLVLPNGASAIQCVRATSDLKSVEATLIHDPAGRTHFGYSSIAVNRAGAVLIGFSQFSDAEYPSAGYIYREPSGKWSERALLKSGTRPYNLGRWGDYSTTVVDPLNDHDFWTVQSYGYLHNQSHATWATWWGKITPPPAVTRGRLVRRY